MMSNELTQCAADELRIVRSRFAAVAEDWRLTDEDAGALLGRGAGGPAANDGSLDVDAETRMRLVVDVAHGLGRVFEPEILLAWLRDPDGGETPLAFMSRGVAELRAMRAAAFLRGRPA